MATNWLNPASSCVQDVTSVSNSCHPWGYRPQAIWTPWLYPITPQKPGSTDTHNGGGQYLFGKTKELHCSQRASCGWPHLVSGEVVKWFPAERPHFKEHHPKTPHITTSAVLAKENGLGGGPLDGDLPSSHHVIAQVCEVSRHAKVSYLWRRECERREEGEMKGGWMEGFKGGGCSTVAL